MESTIVARVSAEPGVESSMVIHDEDATSWGLLEGTCTLFGTVMVIEEATAPEDHTLSRRAVYITISCSVANRSFSADSAIAVSTPEALGFSMTLPHATGLYSTAILVAMLTLMAAWSVRGSYDVAELSPTLATLIGKT